MEATYLRLASSSENDPRTVPEISEELSKDKAIESVISEMSNGSQDPNYGAFIKFLLKDVSGIFSKYNYLLSVEGNYKEANEQIETDTLGIICGYSSIDNAGNCKILTNHELDRLLQRLDSEQHLIIIGMPNPGISKAEDILKFLKQLANQYSDSLSPGSKALPEYIMQAGLTFIPGRTSGSVTHASFRDATFECNTAGNPGSTSAADIELSEIFKILARLLKRIEDNEHPAPDFFSDFIITPDPEKRYRLSRAFRFVVFTRSVISTIKQAFLAITLDNITRYLNDDEVLTWSWECFQESERVYYSIYQFFNSFAEDDTKMISEEVDSRLTNYMASYLLAGQILKKVISQHGEANRGYGADKHVISTMLSQITDSLINIRKLLDRLTESEIAVILNGEDERSAITTMVSDVLYEDLSRSRISDILSEETDLTSLALNLAEYKPSPPFL